MSASQDDTSTILLESFTNPTHTWTSMNDPVMGGESYSSVTVTNGLGIFDGEVADIPFLHAPGFISMRNTITKTESYPDVSSCGALRLNLRSSEEAREYTGYRVGFGDRWVAGNHHARGYKANFQMPPGDGDAMQVVDVPFHEFTVRWNDATGDPVVTCEANPDFCPDVATLTNMKQIAIWGEGVAGKVHLEVASIEAIGCDKTLLTSLLDVPILGASNEVGSHSSSGSAFLSPLAMCLTVAAGFMVGLVYKRHRRGYTSLVDADESITIDV